MSDTAPRFFRFNINLNPEEYQALKQSAQEDLRFIREEARYLLRCELIARGKLPENYNPDGIQPINL